MECGAGGRRKGLWIISILAYKQTRTTRTKELVVGSSRREDGGGAAGGGRFWEDDIEWQVSQRLRGRDMPPLGFRYDAYI